MREREGQVGLDELVDVRTSNIGSLDFSNLDNMNVPETGTMASGHILVAGLDGLDTRSFTEFLVHIVGARARIVSQPDAKVLDLSGVGLVDFIDRDNLRDVVVMIVCASVNWLI